MKTSFRYMPDFTARPFRSIYKKITLMYESNQKLKVAGDSLLIHAFGYSLFIGLCSVTFNMTGYSHLYHSIKLIHCSAPQRDVLSDKMVLWVVTHSFYFMVCQSSLLRLTGSISGGSFQIHFSPKQLKI